MNEMYNQVSWMVPADLAILTIVYQHQIELTSAVVARNINFDRDWIGRRCRELAERGLLEKVGNGETAYLITDLGELVAKSELDPDEIEERTRLEGDE